MVDEEPRTAVVAPPKVIKETKVDMKGRMGVPSEFLPFMRSCPEQRFFITSLDGRIIRIYPLPVWEENEALLDKCLENPKAAGDISFVAKARGAFATLDKEGRILLPPGLRRELDLEGQQVRIAFQRSAVEVYSQGVYQERMRMATDGMDEKLDAIQKLGFK